MFSWGATPDTWGAVERGEWGRIGLGGERVEWGRIGLGLGLGIGLGLGLGLE